MKKIVFLVAIIVIIGAGFIAVRKNPELFKLRATNVSPQDVVLEAIPQYESTPEEEYREAYCYVASEVAFQGMPQTSGTGYWCRLQGAAPCDGQEAKSCPGLYGDSLTTESSKEIYTCTATSCTKVK